MFLNNLPEYALINGKKVKINTDFRFALKCQEIAVDDEINDYERALAIIYTLFGEEALQDDDHLEEYLEKSLKFLQCGAETNSIDEVGEVTFDFEQDWGLVKASFMSDYKKDLDKEQIHWWTFYDLLGGLTDQTILSRVRQVREEPLSGKKGKELDRWIKAKKAVELKPKKTAREKELDKYWEEIAKKGSDS